MTNRSRTIPRGAALKALLGARAAEEVKRDRLRDRLLTTVDSLQRRRADLVEETLISDYVALHWLEWAGGSLRLTQTGSNVCSQIRAGLK